MELVNAAYDSNGSSQKQFEKTTESLESKLNELKNAWNEFAMGIANSDIIKGGVDLLTQIITIFNKITQSGNSLWSMVKKLTAAFVGFKAAKILLNGLLGGFSQLKTGTDILDGLFGGMKKSATKEFGGLATILKRTFSSNRVKWSDFIQEDNIFSNLPSKIADLKYQTTSITKDLNQDLTGVNWAQDADAVVFANAALKEKQIKLTAELAASEGELTLQQSLRKAQEDGLLTTQQMAILLSDKELKTKAAEIISSETLDATQKKEQLSQLALNSGKQVGIGFGLKSALAKLGESKASLINAAAIKSENAAMIAGIATMGIYIAVAAALAAGIIGIVIAVKKAKANSLEGQLESAQKATERATEAAQSAKDAYDELLNGQSNYNSTQETLSELTEETDEFKQALIEANQAVIELIGTYKGLEVSKGEFGQLTITDTSWGKVIEQQWQTVQNANFGQLVTQIREAGAELKLESQKAAQDISGTINTPLYISQLNSNIDISTIKQVQEAAKTYAELLPRYNDLTETEFEEYQVASLTRQNASSLGLYELAAEEFDQVLANYQNKKEGDLLKGTPYEGVYSLSTEGFEHFLDIYSEEIDIYNAKMDALNSEYSALRDSYVSALVESSMDWDEYNFSDDIRDKLTDTMTGSNLLGEDIAQEVDKTIDKEYGELSEAVQNSIEDIAGEKSIADLNKKQLKKVYADLMNISVDEIPDELAKSKSELQEAIANIDLGNTLIEQFEEVFDVLDDLDNDSQEILTDLFSGSAETLDFTGEQIDEALKEFTSKGGDWKKVAAALGIVTDDVKKFSEILTENVTQALTEVNSQVALALTNLTSQMDLVDEYTTQIGTWTIGERQEAVKINNSLVSSLGEDAAGAYWQVMLTLNTSAAREEVNDFLNSFDLSNPIEAFEVFEAIDDDLESTNKDIANLSAGLKELSGEALSASNQMQYFLKTSEFGDLEDSLKDFIDETGEIRADNIEDLCDANKNLKKLIDNNIVSAEGLARILTQIELGTIAFTDLSDAVIASVANFHSLDTIARKAIDSITNFDPGIDENEVAESITSAYELLNENLENGHIGNTQTKNWLKYFYGEDIFDGIETNEQAYELEQTLIAELGKNQDNMFQSFSKLASGYTWENKAIEGSYTSGGTRYFDNYGFNISEGYTEDGALEIQLNLNEAVESTMTSAELAEQIADAYNVSLNYANLMLADFRNNSWELDQMLTANDNKVMASGVLDSLETTKISTPTQGFKYDASTGQFARDENGALIRQTLEEAATLDKSEIETIAQLRGETYDEVLKALQVEASNRGLKLTLTDFFDEEGALKEGEEFWQEFAKTGEKGAASAQELITKHTTSVVTETWDGGTAHGQVTGGAVNANEIISDLTSGTGQSIEQLGPQLQEVISASLSSNINDWVYTYKGQEIPIHIDQNTTAEEVTAAIQEGQEAIDTSITANAFAKAFASAIANQDDVNFNVVYPEGTITEGTTNDIGTAQAYADSNPITIAPELAEIFNKFKIDLDNSIAYAKSHPITVTQTKKVLNSNTTTGGNFASGTSSAPSTGTALGGEEGPELHLTKTGAEIVGANGPELFHIEKKDTVYTASETRKILGANGSKRFSVPRFAGGYQYVPIEQKWSAVRGKETLTGSTSGNTSATSAVADAEEAAEIWENTFDWLYNLTEDINEILRDREKLEREYDRILAKRNTTAKDLWDNVQGQLVVLETERSKQQEMYDKRKWEMEDYISKNSDLQKYAWYNWDDMTIEIDWDKIDAVTDEGTGEAIEDYVSKLEDIQDEMDDAEDELMDIEDRIEEILEQGKDEYLDFENMVFEALQAQKQALIDNASEISEAIADTNSNLLDALSDSFSQMREDRELEEDKTSLEDQQKKLIYLQQDTSGGNALEILKLQQEMEDAQQSYTDKLIDRKIDELQQQNDEASEQRERQIELAQEQLDHWSESQAKWEEIHALMGDGINSVGQIISDSELMKVLQDKEGVESLSSYGQMDWLKTLEEDVKAGLTWFAQNQQLEKIGKTSGTIKFTDSSGTEHTGTVNSDGSVTVRDDENGGNWTYSQVFKNYDGSYRTFEENASFKKDPEPEPPKTVVEDNTPKEDNEWDGRRVKKTGWTGVYMYDSKTYYAYDYVWYNHQKAPAEDGYVWVGYSRSDITGKVPKSGLTRYKTGGIADYTGPAWLDGTPSKPEIVLNAQDTKNFIELKNVLASLMTNSHGADSTTNSMGNGDNYYDIDISVESISSDYDVEQVASKIKGMIVQDGLYRNVNSINRLK